MKDFDFQFSLNNPLAGLVNATAGNKFGTQRFDYPIVDGDKVNHYIQFSILVEENSLDYKTELGMPVIPRADNPNLAAQSIEKSAKTIAGASGGLSVFSALFKEGGGLGAAGSEVIGAGARMYNLEKLANVTARKKLLTTINLFTPGAMNFSDRHGWDGVSQTEALGTLGLAAATLGSRNEAIQIEAAGALGGTGEGLGAVGADFGRAALNSQGFAKNPQMELMYNQPELRSWIFEFLFAPRSQEESVRINNIIRYFRYHAAPEMSGADPAQFRNFVVPSKFEIDFFYKNIRNPFLPRIGECALTTVDVDYAPNGTWQTFADGSPVFTKLQLSFQELTTISKNKIKEGF